LEEDSSTLLPVRNGDPSDRMDVPGAVGQFLRDVDLADLVVELVQNELDAGASRTHIDFGVAALVCQGNGKSFDDKAWSRLESVLGAGGEVAPKRDGIGSKNHGLRTLFLIVDWIGVQSGGMRADLTVRSDRQKPQRFRPGYWPRTPDPSGPPVGTRITAPYRARPIRVPDGDNTTRQPLTSAELDALFEQALQDASDRFISASAPGAPWHYVLTLSRAGRPTCEFTFKCSALTGTRRRLWLRTCRNRVDAGPVSIVERRHAVRFPIQVGDGGKVPRLFRTGGRLFGELNWRVDRVGRPKAGPGRLRYPISFTSPTACSGHGYDISAPFIAGRARHNVSIDGRNAELIESARIAFVQASGFLSRVYGAAVGELVRSTAANPQDYPLERQVVVGMLEKGALRAVSLDARGKKAPETSAVAGGPVTVVRSRAGGTALEEEL